MNDQGSTLLGGKGYGRARFREVGAVKRRSDRLRGGGRVGSVTTVGCSHSRQDAARGARARRQVDDDRLALDSALAVLVAEGVEARDAVVVLTTRDDARLRDHGGGRSEITRDPVAEVRSTRDPLEVSRAELFARTANALDGRIKLGDSRGVVCNALLSTRVRIARRGGRAGGEFGAIFGESFFF